MSEFLSGRVAFTQRERWQTAYLPVYALWACVVVVVFPPVFGFRSAGRRARPPHGRA